MKALYFVAGFLLCMMLMKNCNNSGLYSETRIDTVYQTVKDSSNWYRPNITVFEPGRIPDAAPKPKEVVRVDSFTSFEYVHVPVDTLAILQDYYARLFYSDTTRTQYGTVVINDSVTMNRIMSRQVLTNFQIPTITKTVTIRERNKRFGLGIHAGYGFSNSVRPSPQIGLSLHYSFIKF